MSALLDRPRLARRGSPSRRRLLAAVTALFVFDGAVFGSWAARIPDVTAQVGASHTTLGLALLCISLGALASMQLAGALCARLGPGLVAAASAVLVSGAVALPGLAHSLPELAVALLAFGAATGAVNVAANTVGVGLETAGDRPTLPGLHAGFSFGGLAGALIGGVVAGGAVAPHLLGVAAVGLLLSAAIAPVLVAGDADRPAPAARDDRPRQARSGPRALLLVLGLIAGCTAYGEGAVTDWGALHLRGMQASPAVAAAGYGAFALAMACGRLGGARMIRALGTTQVLVYGSLLAAAGMLLAALAPVPTVALVGFALVGLGLANVFPLAIARAGALGGPSGVAMASTVGYTGLLGGPPVIGLLVGAVGLPAALASVSLLAALAGGLSLAVAPERDLLAGRVSEVIDAGRERAVAGLTPAVVRCGPAARRWAGDLTLLGPDAGPGPDRTLTPLAAVSLR